MRNRVILKYSFAGFLCLCAFAGTIRAQPSRVPVKNDKVITQIDINKLEVLLKPNGKPLLINFWATWCDPCREEFPDLVKLDTLYKGKIDFITISLDELSEIDGDVPKFLTSMKAEMSAYLLHTSDDSAAIKMVSKDWAGNLPLTLLIETSGKVAYQRGGRIRFDTLKENIDRVIGAPVAGNGIFETIDLIKIKDGKRDEAIYYYENNWRFYRAEALRRSVIDSYELIDARSDAGSAFDLILITRYRGETQLANSEKAFEPIIKELTPNGPFLKGTSKPDEFRQIVSSHIGKAMFTSAK